MAAGGKQCSPHDVVHTICWAYGRSGLAVTSLTAVWEDQGSNPTVDSCMFIVNITTIYSLGHGLHTLTAVPRSTQPSTFRGMVKWVSAFGLSNNNKWRWWVWFLAAYRRTHSPGRLAQSESRRPLGAVPYSSHEPDELRSGFELWWQHHKHCRYYYYYYYYMVCVDDDSDNLTDIGWD